MSLKKRLQAIEDQLAQISNITLKKANDLDRQNDLLKDVKVGVSKVNLVFDTNTLRYKVVIGFKIPDVTLYFDDNGEETESPILRAMNLLGLISMSDSTALSNKIREAKEKNNESR